MPRYALLALLLCLALAVPSPGTVPLWTHEGSAPVEAMALSSDGSVVAFSSNALHIMDRNGSLQGTSFRANDVAVSANGDLVLSGTDEGVHAFAPNGTERWTSPNETVSLALPESGGTIAALGPDGGLAFLDADGNLLDAEGAGPKGGGVRVAASRSGSVVAAAYRRGVRVLSSGGGQRWAAELPSPYAIAVNASGALVAVGDGGSVKFFNQTGTRTVRLFTGGAVRSLAMASGTELTVAGDADGSLFAFGPNGALAWRRAVGRGPARAAVSGSGNVVAAASAEGTLLVYDRNGTMLWETPVDGDPGALAVSGDGTTVAVGTDRGTAYLFETGVTPAPTPTRAVRNATGPATWSAGRSSGDLTVLGNMTVEGDLTVTGDVSATGYVTVQGRLTEEGDAGTAADEDAALAETLAPDEPDLLALDTVPPDDEVPTVRELLPGEEDLAVDETLPAEDDLVIEETVPVEDEITLDETLPGEEDLPPSGAVPVVETATAQATPGARGGRNLTAGGDPVAPGSGTVSGDLAIRGNFTVEGDLVVLGNLSAAGDLTVIGDLRARRSETRSGNATVSPTVRTEPEQGSVVDEPPPETTPDGRERSGWPPSPEWDALRSLGHGAVAGEAAGAAVAARNASAQPAPPRTGTRVPFAATVAVVLIGALAALRRGR